MSSMNEQDHAAQRAHDELIRRGLLHNCWTGPYQVKRVDLATAIELARLGGWSMKAIEAATAPNAAVITGVGQALLAVVDIPDVNEESFLDMLFEEVINGGHDLIDDAAEAQLLYWIGCRRAYLEGFVAGYNAGFDAAQRETGVNY